MSASHHPKPDDLAKAALHVCTAFLLFTIMQACTKLLTGQHHVIEIAFWRNLISIAPMIVFVVMTGRYKLLKTDMPGVLAGRVLIGIAGLLLTFAAVQQMPMADANTLFFTSALIIPVLAHFMLKEYVGWRRWVAIVVGFGGVWLVAHPNGEVTIFGIMLALGAAATHATIQVLIRKMKHVSAFTITFYFFLGGIVIPGLFMPFLAHPPTLYSALLLLGTGIFGGLGQYFVTSGFQKAPTSFLAPFNYTGLLWATGLDILIWNYVPHWSVFAGAGLIMTAQLYILHREKVAGLENH